MARQIQQAGFSLIELVIVVAIIAVIAAIAVPRLSRGAEAAEVNSFSSSLSGLVAAIERYHAIHGALPSHQPANAMPPEIVQAFYGDRGSKFQALGGGEWLYMIKSNAAVICIEFDHDQDDADMQLVDAIVDDGDLSSGLLIKQNNHKFEYCIR